MKKGSWKKLKSKIINKNPWYCFREDDVIRPDGKRGKYYYIDGVDSATIITEDSDGKIYLVGQSRYPAGNIFTWELITGGLEKGGSALRTAKKELEEEAGIKAKQWICLGYFRPITGYGSEKCYVYLAKNLEFTKPNREGTEDIEVVKKSLSEILKMIKNNKITCGISIAAINKYLIYKNKLTL